MRRTPSRPSRSRRALVLSLSLVVLSACGGGGSVPTADPAPPVPGGSLLLLATSPAPGSTDVPPDTAISATFNESLDPDLLDDSWLRVSVDGQFLTGTVSLSPSDARQVLLDLDQPLPLDTVVLATLSSAVVDVQGRGLGAPQQWLFTTAGVQAADELSFQVFPPLQQSNAALVLVSARIVDAAEDRLAVSWQSHLGTASFFETAFWTPVAGLSANLSHAHPPSSSDTAADGQGGLLARVHDASLRIDTGITVSSPPPGFALSDPGTRLVESDGALAVRLWCPADESATAAFDAEQDLWIPSEPLSESQGLSGEGPFPAAGGGFLMIDQGGPGSGGGSFVARSYDRTGNLVEEHDFGPTTETALFYSFDHAPDGHAILVLASPSPSGARFRAFDLDPAVGWSDSQDIATTDLALDNSDLFTDLVALGENGAAVFATYQNGDSRLYWRESANAAWFEQAYEHPGPFGILQPRSVAVGDDGRMLVAAVDGGAEVHVVGKPAGSDSWTEITNLEDVNVLQVGAITQQLLLAPADEGRFLLAYRGKPGTFEEAEIGVVLVGFQ